MAVRQGKKERTTLNLQTPVTILRKKKKKRRSTTPLAFGETFCNSNNAIKRLSHGDCVIAQSDLVGDHVVTLCSLKVGELSH